MNVPLITKYDTAALLISEGVQRGFSVVSEFSVVMPPEWPKTATGKRRTKSIDVVWLTLLDENRTRQKQAWSEHWQVAAAFEIEGCNVSHSPRGSFAKDLAALTGLSTRGKFERERFIVLYTDAFDRSTLDNTDRDRDFRRCDDALQGTTVSAFVCGQLNWESMLPTR